MNALEKLETPYAHAVLQAVLEAVQRVSTDPETGQMTVRSGEACLALVTAAAAVMGAAAAVGAAPLDGRSIAKDVEAAFRKRFARAAKHYRAGRDAGTLDISAGPLA